MLTFKTHSSCGVAVGLKMTDIRGFINARLGANKLYEEGCRRQDAFITGS